MQPGHSRKVQTHTNGNDDSWIADDTGSVKKGSHLVGVARQYGGQAGKADNSCRFVTARIHVAPEYQRRARDEDIFAGYLPL